MEKIKDIHVPTPTFQRLKAPVATLTSLCYQFEKNFEIVISDQSLDEDIYNDKTIQTIINLLELHGRPVSILKNFPLKGMAQQRQFLLEKSDSCYSLFLAICVYT